MDAVVVLLLLSVVASWADEPRCSKYDYEERILSKILRMEIKQEKLEKQIELLQSTGRSSTSGNIFLNGILCS